MRWDRPRPSEAHERNIHAHGRALNRRQSEPCKVQSSAVGIARSCNSYSVRSGARTARDCEVAALAAPWPEIPCQCTAWKLLDGHHRQWRGIAATLAPAESEPDHASVENFRAQCGATSP